jgi:Tetratricopeptide repeat
MLMRMVVVSMIRRLGILALGIALAAIALIASAQAPPPAASPRMESVQDLLGRLTPEQKQKFEDANKLFNAQQFAGALPIYKQLLDELKDDPVLLKLATEAALNAGDTGYALTTLKPLAGANPNDWQAAALLARACVAGGDKPCRDAQMAHMIELYHQGAMPPGMKNYILERIPVGENTLTIRPSVEPWGRYQVYDLGQVSDKDGHIFLRITLESNDTDQGLFAQQHPKEAAAGIRSFTLDGYQETGLNSDGQRTQTHYTYKFLVGQPSYDAVRDAFLEIAAGKGHPLTSSTNPVVP